MTETIIKKPPEVCPIDLKDWNATHTIRGIPVMRYQEPWEKQLGRRVFNKAARFWAQDGTQVRLLGANLKSQLVPIQREPEIPNNPPPPAIPHFTQATVKPVTPAGKIMFHAEIARAILHAASWPAFGEAYGHADVSSGQSADLMDRMPDGSYRVRVCDTRLPGGIVYVKVPQNVEFELVEGE